MKSRKEKGGHDPIETTVNGGPWDLSVVVMIHRFSITVKYSVAIDSLLLSRSRN